jgi:hypothetical protein
VRGYGFWRRQRRRTYAARLQAACRWAVRGEIRRSRARCKIGSGDAGGRRSLGHVEHFVNRTRRFSKTANRHLADRIAGTRLRMVYFNLSELHHTGRRSGRAYTTPLSAYPLGDGFILAVAYPEVDWCRSILASGRCCLTRNGEDYELDRPEVISLAEAMKAYPLLVKPFIVAPGTKTFGWLHRGDPYAKQYAGAPTAGGRIALRDRCLPCLVATAAERHCCRSTLIRFAARDPGAWGSHHRCLCPSGPPHAGQKSLVRAPADAQGRYTGVDVRQQKRGIDDSRSLPAGNRAGSRGRVGAGGGCCR